MRVVHIVPAIFGPRGVVGGAERYVLELARHMANRVPTTLVSFGERREERLGNLRVKVLDRVWKVRGQAFNPIALGLAPELLRADIVHCHQQHVLASSVSAIIARATRRRVFATDLGGGGWDVSAYISTDSWYHGHLHISAYSRRVYGHESKRSAYVIYGGVDHAKFHPAPRASRTGRSALYVGRLLPHKGVRYLVEAATPEVPVILLGQPYDKAYLSELKELAVGKNVVFRHGCSDEELVAAYQQALCVVLPSVYRTQDGLETRVPELLGQTLLEGMACGIPAICAEVASMPEVVVDGVTGFVVPPNDAVAIRNKMTWLAAHPDEAARMGHAGRQRVVERFDWDSVVQRCLAIYGRGLAQSGSSP